MTRKTILILLTAGLGYVCAQAEYYIIRNYHVEVTFTEEGYADFDEVLEVEFTEQRHGIIRQIPYRDRIQGETVDRIFRNVSVEGFKFTTSKQNYNLLIKIGDADVWVNGRQTYRIHYRILNPLNFFEDHIEYYWDLIGTSWPVVIEAFSYRVRFPEKVGLREEDVRFYTGSAGEQGQDASLLVSSTEVSGQTKMPFAPGEGLTLAVFIPGDVFKPMDAWTSFRARHGLLLAPIIFLLGGFLAKFTARNKRQTIMTEFFPPDGISPAIAGGFIDHSVDNNDVLSLIPHLANKGYLRMEAEEGQGFLKKDKIFFYRLKDAGTELLNFEKEFFTALFSYGDVVELRSLKDKFYMHMSAVQSSVRSWIKDQGWYQRDQQRMGCLTGIGGLAALGWGAYAVFARQNLDGIALIATGVILFFLASRFHKRSPAGNETYRKLEGFRQFIAKAERPVIERLLKEDPLYYDKTMPYALAYGYLKKWNKLFEGLLSQPPSWYSGHGMYGAALTRSWSTFSESFPAEINQIGSVFSSAPSSSGSGGGGGGGFSGGGSGGGGGSSW
jgi:uncharacterized membrane protein